MPFRRLVAIFLLPYLVGAAYYCPTGGVLNSGQTHCYFFFSQQETFSDANRICSDDKGFLAAVHNGFDNSVIMSNANSKFGSSTTFWLGGMRNSTSESFKWIDGSAFNYQHWASGQPSSTDGLRCIAENLPAGTWTTDDCGSKKPFVCASTSLDDTPANATTEKPPFKVCPGRWQFYAPPGDPIGNCYYMIQYPTWNVARKNCRDVYQADLASIHSAEENEFLYNFIIYNFMFPFIGLMKVNGTWQWSDGSKLDFINWAPGEPDNTNGTVSGGEFCSQMYRDLDGNHPEMKGTWNDVDCNQPADVGICKKRATTRR